MWLMPNASSRPSSVRLKEVGRTPAFRRRRLIRRGTRGMKAEMDDAEDMSRGRVLMVEVKGAVERKVSTALVAVAGVRHAGVFSLLVRDN